MRVFTRRDFLVSKDSFISESKSIFSLSQNIAPKKQYFCVFYFFDECNSNNETNINSYSNKGLAKKITKLKENNMKLKILNGHKL